MEQPRTPSGELRGYLFGVIVEHMVAGWCLSLESDTLLSTLGKDHAVWDTLMENALTASTDAQSMGEAGAAVAKYLGPTLTDAQAKEFGFLLATMAVTVADRQRESEVA